MGAEENRKLAEEFVRRAFNEHDLAFVKEVLADDYVEHEVWPGLTPDRDGALQWFESSFQAVPDLSMEVHHIVASGDRVAIHSTMRGTDEGGLFPGMPATGKSFEMGVMDIVRIRDDGKVAEHWGVGDAMGLMIQLGHVQPPPPPAG
jgi:steroid delta-isomerase-like uncharacterized protein